MVEKRDMEDDGLDDILEYEGLPKLDEDSDEETPDTEKQDSDLDGGKDVEEAPATTDTEEPDAADSEPKEGEDEEKAEDSEVDGKQDEEKPKTFKYKGKEYSQQDLLNDPDLFNKVVTAANQQTHYQDLHLESKTKIEQIERKLAEREAAEQEWQRQQAEAAAAAGAPVIKPEHVSAWTKDAIKGFVDDGWVEEDFAELYPNTMSSMAYLRDNMLGRLFRVEAALESYLQHAFQKERTETTRGTWGQLNSAIDSVANEGGVFAPLTDNETRMNFLRRLQETVNPEVEQLIQHPEIIRNLWIAENQEAFVQAASKQRAAAEAAAAAKRRNAAGEGGGVQRAPARQRPQVQEFGVDEGWADLDREDW
jgi:hypothetical protein